jgi:hypothetical protein
MQDATTLNAKRIYHKNKLKFSPQLRLDDLSLLLFLVFCLHLHVHLGTDIIYMST